MWKKGHFNNNTYLVYNTGNKKIQVKNYENHKNT